MKKFILSIAIILLSLTAMNAQEEVWNQWDNSIIEKANTALDFEFYNEEEKKIVLLMNLARTDGKLFASTFVDYYIQSTSAPKTNYVNSLYRDLNNVKGLALLVPKKDLSDIANGHATKSGKSGHVGHKDMQKRFDPVFGSTYNHMAENCSYGYNDALKIVITLLIDEGVKSLGHRKNILNEFYHSVGVATRSHSVWEYNCVIDFGGNS